MSTSVHVRPARAADRTQMLEITRDVWEGTDYFPFVWDRWLSDSGGELLAAVSVDGVVGFLHASQQEDSTAWLEGIRVAESVRGQGVGTQLLRAGLDWSCARGCPRARLSTASMNDASNAMALRVGMQRIATFAPLEVTSEEPGGDVPTLPAQVAATTARAAIWHFLTARTGGGTRLYTDGWTAYSLTEERLAALLASFSVIIAGEDGIEAVGIVSAGTRGTIKIGLLVGSQNGMAAIGQYVRIQTGHSGHERLRAMVTSDAQTALERVGYSTRGEYREFVYEIHLI